MWHRLIYINNCTKLIFQCITEQTQRCISSTIGSHKAYAWFEFLPDHRLFRIRFLLCKCWNDALFGYHSFLPNSFQFISRPAMRHYIVWVTDSVIKYTPKKNNTSLTCVFLYFFEIMFKCLSVHKQVNTINHKVLVSFFFFDTAYCQFISLEKYLKWQFKRYITARQFTAT